MTTMLFTNIGELVTCDASLGDGTPLRILRDAGSTAAGCGHARTDDRVGHDYA